MCIRDRYGSGGRVRGALESRSYSRSSSAHKSLDALERLLHGPLHPGGHAAELEQSPLAVLRQVPALANPSASVHRLEFVAPDLAAAEASNQAWWAGLPGDPAILLELDHVVDHRVADAGNLHRHDKGRSQREPLRGAGLGSHDSAGPVDLSMPGRVGHEGEDRLRRSRDDPFNGKHITSHLVSPDA